MRAAPSVVALAGALALLAPPPHAAADTLLLKDTRVVDVRKAAKQADGSWKLSFEHGDVVLPATMVKDGWCEAAAASTEDADLLGKGLVPYEGKWIPKAERDARVAKKREETKKRVDEAKAHREWRNRYRTKTANFEFEYTIPPDVAKEYMDLMEAYYATFSKTWGVARPPKERLKVCFYRDYDSFLETSGAPRGVIGYFNPRPPRELNFFYDRSRPSDTLEVMFHETQHYLANLLNLNFWMPHNIAESFAEYYGGSTWDPVKKTVIMGGNVLEGRLVEVQTDVQKGEHRSLAKFLADELGYDDYTWGWSFVHFIMSSPKYSKRFVEFYKALPRGKDKDIVRTATGPEGMLTVSGDVVTAVFKRYLGVTDLGALEKEWYDYLDSTLKVQTVIGLEEAAFRANDSDRPIRAKRFFGLAVDKGSTNPTVFLKYGDLVAYENHSLAIDLYKKGLSFDPLDAELYAALGWLTRSLGGDENEKEGKRLIELAREIDPDNVDFVILMEEALAKAATLKPPPSSGMDGD